jgi:lia operon protein LiaG
MNARNAAPQAGALKKVLVITAIVAAAGLAAAAVTWLVAGPSRFGAGFGAAVEELKSVDAAGAAQVAIRGVSEDVRVVVGQAGAVEARLHGSSGARDSAAAPRLSVERQGTSVVISVERPKGVIFGWSTLVLDVTLPAGWAGAVAVETVSGDVTLPSMAVAGLAVRTVSGDAVLGDVRTPRAALHTTSGTVRADGLVVGTAEIISVSGDLVVRRLAGSARVRSTSGDVRLALPADAAFRLDARSTSGRVTCGFPIQLVAGTAAGRDHALVGTVGDGRDEVSVTTVSGDIAVTR